MRDALSPRNDPNETREKRDEDQRGKESVEETTRPWKRRMGAWRITRRPRRRKGKKLAIFACL
jgi:hypothetical protein